MNRISINLKCGDSVDLVDPDQTSPDDLLDNLSTLFSVNNVAILKGEKTSVIIRPSDISSIKVESLLDDVPVVEKKSPPPQKIEPKKEYEDIITDMD